MMPSLISGWPNFGVVGRDDEVAHHGQLAAAAQGKAADGRDHRLAHAADLLPVAGDVVLVVDVGEGVGGHGADVGAGGKRLFAAGQDDAADAVVGVKAFERLAQLIHELVVQGVELLGPVQGDDAHFEAFRAFGAGFNGFVGGRHVGSPFELKMRLQ
jgi:hypothetical protein